MEQLTWTGPFGTVFDPVFLIALALVALGVLASVTRSAIATPEAAATVGADGSLAMASQPRRLAPGIVMAALLIGVVGMIWTGFSWAGFGTALAVGLVLGAILAFALDALPAALPHRLLIWAVFALIGVLAIYLVMGVLLPRDSVGIIGNVSKRLTPVWVALIATFVLSLMFKRRLGLYGKLFDSTVGMIGFAIVMFWVFVALFGAGFDWIATHDALSQVSGMKNKVPGTPLSGAGDGDYPYYLLGGDNLARDVFSRAVVGSGIVIVIAPAATLFAFMVGITLGLPAGYFGGRLDTILSFLANLILAFPVILLFYLLVTPEIVLTGIPNYMAAVLFVFPLIFAFVLLNSRYHTRPGLRTPLIAGVLAVMGWIYLSLVSQGRTDWLLPEALDGFDVAPGILVVFVSVVFVNSPTVFRIVRGLALELGTRDYVAAAQTRGEGPWYIMLWEILPNARGPLIVDFCLRIGYTTILLGTLGFFGLGLPPESPDWGSTINEGRKLLLIFAHPPLPPALALLTLVLGLNLLADGLREESLKD